MKRQSNKEIWAQAAKLVGEAELARRFRVWCLGLIRRERAKRENKSQAALFMEDAKKVIADLNEVSGRAYTLSDDAKSLIRGRMAEGAGWEEFRKVHRAMAGRWLEDEKMRDYLRPSTLYRRGRFFEYLALAGETKQPQKQQQPAQKQQPRMSETELAMIMARPWWDFDSWADFMRWTAQIPDAISLAKYEMPDRVRQMRAAPLMFVKVIQGRVDWAEDEYAAIKRQAGK